MTTQNAHLPRGDRRDLRRRLGKSRAHRTSARLGAALVAGVILIAPLALTGCANQKQPVQSQDQAKLPEPGADGEYDPSLPQPKRMEARYIRIDVGPAEEGCPTEVPFFDFDKAKAKPQDDVRLRELAACLNAPAHRDADVRLVGRTDAQGTAKYNQQLGLERANGVKELLIAHGVAASRISVDSAGERGARAHQDPAVGAGYDRRVDVVQLEIRRPK